MQKAGPTERTNEKMIDEPAPASGARIVAVADAAPTCAMARLEAMLTSALEKLAASARWSSGRLFQRGWTRLPGASRPRRSGGRGRSGPGPTGPGPTGPGTGTSTGTGMGSGGGADGAGAVV